MPTSSSTRRIGVAIAHSSSRRGRPPPRAVGEAARGQRRGQRRGGARAWEEHGRTQRRWPVRLQRRARLAVGACRAPGRLGLRLTMSTTLVCVEVGGQACGDVSGRRLRRQRSTMSYQCGKATTCELCPVCLALFGSALMRARSSVGHSEQHTDHSAAHHRDEKHKTQEPLIQTGLEPPLCLHVQRSVGVASIQFCILGYGLVHNKKNANINFEPEPRDDVVV